MARNGHIRRIEHALEGTSPLSDPVIAASWQRCLDSYGIDPGERRRHAIAEHPTVRHKRDRIGALFNVARHEMQALYSQISQSGYTILLSDADGLVLERVADPGLEDLLDQAGLISGAHWGEAYEGTNGIGTCISEKRAVTVHRTEHFRYEHISLSCSAAPIRDVDGTLLAILDASSVNSTEGQDIQSHTRALVDLSARVIENGHFRRTFRENWLLRFHPREELIGFTQEAILALDDLGHVIGANESALVYLRRANRTGLVGCTLEDLFGCTLDQLMEHASQGALIRPFQLYPDGGSQVFHGYLTMSAKPIKPVFRSAPASNPKKVEQKASANPFTLSDLSGHDPLMIRNIRKIRKISDLDIPLMIQGETGTGKEVLARAIHQESDRAEKAFIAVNCAALPGSLLESELFGYAPGAFTGAGRKGFKGRILEADGGTLFLDEIGDMPLEAQTRLLRVLEEREVTALGREGSRKVDIRIICATHQDLAQKVDTGDFRADLYYRLKGFGITLPPVRDRQDKHRLMMQILQQEHGAAAPHMVTPDALTALETYNWPGNIREMRNVLRMALALSEEAQISLWDLPEEIPQPAPSAETTGRLPGSCGTGRPAPAFG